MRAIEFALFDTAIGRCGIAWGGAGVVAVQLPEDGDAATRARLVREFPGARAGTPPPDVRRAIEGIVALVHGEARDLSAVALDMERVPPFHRRVYQAARAIPPGATASYGAIADALGSRGAARAVGQALGRNPFAIVVPCHRVLAAGGRAGGFSAHGGVATKLRLLAIEGDRARAPVPSRLRRRADPGFDAVAAVAHLRAADPAMRRVIDRIGPFTLRRTETSDLFAALAEAIVYQQLNGRAAATIFGRVRALFGDAAAGPSADQILGASDEALRSAGLSRAKMLALQDLSRRTRAGELPTIAEAERIDDEALVERLTAVRGIGRWTVEMLLIFRLGRPDVLPADDYGVRQGFALAVRRTGLPSRADVEAYGARWKPYRTVASWYLWRALEHARATSQAATPARATRVTT